MVDDNVLEILQGLAVPLADIELSAIRAQGAGGQNVNKVATAIHLRFDFASCNTLPDRLKQKLRETNDHRITADGHIVIKSQEFRSQEKNRKAALQRLREMLVDVQQEQKPRKATKPSKGSRAKRMDDKKRRGRLKQSRNSIDD